MTTILTLPPHDLTDVNRRSVAAANLTRAAAAYATAELTLLAKALRKMWGTVGHVVFNKDFDDDGHTDITLLLIVSTSGELIWFNDEYAYDYPGADAISDDRGRPYVDLDEETVREIEYLLAEAYDASDDLPREVDTHWEDAEFDGEMNNLLRLDIEQVLTAADRGPSNFADSQHPDALVEVMALLERLESSGQDFDLGLIRSHIPEKVRAALAPEVARVNAELVKAGY